MAEDGIIRYMYWMRAKDVPHYGAAFQKVGSLVCLTVSDLYISTVHLELSLRFILVRSNFWFVHCIT